MCQLTSASILFFFFLPLVSFSTTPKRSCLFFIAASSDTIPNLSARFDLRESSDTIPKRSARFSAAYKTNVLVNYPVLTIKVYQQYKKKNKDYFEIICIGLYWYKLNTLN